MKLRYFGLFILLLSLGCGKGNEALSDDNNSKVAILKKIELQIGNSTYIGKIEQQKVTFLVEEIPAQAKIKTLEITGIDAVSNRKKGDNFDIINGKSSLVLTSGNGTIYKYSLIFEKKSEPIKTSSIANLKSIRLKIGQDTYEGKIDMQQKSVTFFVKEISGKATIETLEIEDEKAKANLKIGDMLEVKPTMNNPLIITAENGSINTYKWFFLQSSIELKKLEIEIEGQQYQPRIVGNRYIFEILKLKNNPEVTITELVVADGATTNKVKNDLLTATNNKFIIKVTGRDGTTEMDYNIELVDLKISTEITSLEIDIAGNRYTPEKKENNQYHLEIMGLLDNPTVTIIKLGIATHATANLAVGQKLIANGNQFKIKVEGGNDVTEYTVIIKKAIPLTILKRVIIEEFSGQDCPNCPDGYAIVKKLLLDNPDHLVAVTIHAGGLSRPELRIPEGQRLWDYFNYDNYQPRAIIDRANNKRVYQTSSWVTEVNKRITQTAKVAITVGTPQLTGLKLKAKVTLRFAEAVTEPLKITAYITENNIIAYQEASASNNYNHQHILRSIVSKSHLGDKLADSFTANQVLMHTLESTIPSTINTQNANLVVIISKSSNDEALNAIEVSLK